MPGPRQHPRPLQEGGRGDHDHRVALPGHSDLEQQGYVEHDEPLAARRRAPQEGALDPAHARVDDRLQPAQRVAVGEDALAQDRAVDRAVPDRAGKRGLHRRDRAAAPRQQPVHGHVRIVDRHAEVAEHRGRRRLTHADRSGQPDDHHAGQPGRSAATWARSASSTTGSTPYQPAKPGRAWWSSISRPSTARRPRARADASSPVSSGV